MPTIRAADDWIKLDRQGPTRPAAEDRQRLEYSQQVLDCLGGKMEKRLPIAMVVNLAPVHALSGNGTELTYTDNLSAHGACVVSNRQWQPGEIAEVTSFSDQTAMRGRVVYCRRHGNGQYAIGLNFQNSAVIWSVYLKYASRARVTATVQPRFTK